MAEAKPAAPAQGKGEQDPSMEEILQSIRRIIAEDDKPGEAKDDAKSAAPADLSSDVLELTEMVQDDGGTVLVGADAQPKLPEGAAVDVLAHIDSALAAPLPPKEPEQPKEPAPAKAPAAAPAAAAPLPAAPAPVQDNDRLLSDHAAAGAVAAMKKLEQAKEQPVVSTPSMAFRNGHTIEDLVMETLKPMLKDWLNANLPGIVERIVEREIKKLT